MRPNSFFLEFDRLICFQRFQHLEYNGLDLPWCSTSYKKGHAWVCDGYRSSTIYSEDCSTGWGYLYLHMNWGWDNAHTGWYSYNNWNPGDRSYNHKKEMIYNIKP